MNTPAHAVATPWYREPWPWLLMAGPAIVVVAGFVTLALAIESSDGLVADDYYKQGKAINMTLRRDARARELGYRVAATLSNVTGRVSLAFVKNTPEAAELRLTLHHPTRGGLDRELILSRGTDGHYSAALPAIDKARWSLTLDDASREWRLTGEWPMNEQPVVLGGEQ